MALGQKFNKTDVGLYSMAYDELYFTDNMVWLVSKVSNLVALDVPTPKYSNPTSRITIIIKQYILLPRPLELWTTISTIWIFYSALKQNPCEFQNMVMVLFTHQTRVLNFYLDIEPKKIYKPRTLMIPFGRAFLQFIQLFTFVWEYSFRALAYSCILHIDLSSASSNVIISMEYSFVCLFNMHS